VFQKSLLQIYIYKLRDLLSLNYPLTSYYSKITLSNRCY